MTAISPTLRSLPVDLTAKLLPPWKALAVSGLLFWHLWCIQAVANINKRLAKLINEICSLGLPVHGEVWSVGIIGEWSLEETLSKVSKTRGQVCVHSPEHSHTQRRSVYVCRCSLYCACVCALPSISVSFSLSSFSLSSLFLFSLYHTLFLASILPTVITENACLSKRLQL